MKTIIETARVTFRGGVRDKVFITLLTVSVICFIFIIPAVGSLSMRQVREVTVSFSLSVISFVSLVLTVFLGVNLVYRDIERRFAHSVITLPVSREQYIIGKFLGLSAIIATGMLILSLFSLISIIMASAFHQSSIPMVWENFVAALFFEFIALSVIGAVSILFSSFATNLFLPLFATIGFYIVGNVTQAVMDYLHTSFGKKLPQASIYLSGIAYYLFPNLTALDFKFNAIYGLSITFQRISAALSYGLLYLVVVLGLSLMIFRRRDII